MPKFSYSNKIYGWPGFTAMFFAGFGTDQNAFPREGIQQAIQYGKKLT